MRLFLEQQDTVPRLKLLRMATNLRNLTIQKPRDRNQNQRPIQQKARMMVLLNLHHPRQARRDRGRLSQTPQPRLLNDQRKGALSSCPKYRVHGADSDSNFRIPAQPFKAPTGFQPLSTGTSSLDLQGFDNLDGKQVWHISAPASVDLTMIKDLDIGAALRGESILTASGIDYGMQPASDQAEILLLASGNPVSYKQKTTVNRAFRLRQVANDSTNPVSNSPSETAVTDGLHFTAQVPGKKKQPRQQPSSLKYRHAPLGVDKAVPKITDDVHLAESILLKAASQRTDTSERAGDADESTEKRKKEKKKKKTKTDG